jgi:hypothetical protein
LRGHDRIAAQSEKTVGIEWVHESPLRSRVRRSRLTLASNQPRLRRGDQTSGRTLRAQLSSVPILTRELPFRPPRCEAVRVVCRRLE